jgi:PleD family two-component response regulator
VSVHVLLVDEGPRTFEIVAILRSEDILVTVVRTARAALAEFHHAVFDTVLLNVDMSAASAFSLDGLLQSLPRDVPVLVLAPPSNGVNTIAAPHAETLAQPALAAAIREVAHAL